MKVELFNFSAFQLTVLDFGLVLSMFYSSSWRKLWWINCPAQSSKWQTDKNSLLSFSCSRTRYFSPEFVKIRITHDHWGQHKPLATTLLEKQQKKSNWGICSLWDKRIHHVTLSRYKNRQQIATKTEQKPSTAAQLLHMHTFVLHMISILCVCMCVCVCVYIIWIYYGKGH